MSLFSRLSHSGDAVAIANIQNGAVSVAIAVVHSDKPLEIISVGESILSFEDRSDEAAAAALPDQIAEAGKKALDAYAASPKNAGPVSKVFAIINTPWATSQTLRIISVFEKETLITDAMISDLAKQALGGATELDTSRLIEANLVRIELNGYVTTEPVGKTAHKISAYALLSTCQADVQSAVQNGLQSIFNDAKFVFRSQLRTVLSAVESLPDIPEDFCLMDMTRNTSIIANIHSGLALAHQTADEGFLSIVKRISGKGMPEETIALLHLIARDECSTEACSRLLETIVKVEPDIVRIFADTMSELVKVRYLPPSLILLCDGALIHWLTEVFERIDFTQFTTTTREFHVTTFDPATLRQFVTIPAELRPDGRLLLAAALAQAELKQD